MSVFGDVADHYDAGRPGYPPGIFDALGDLGGGVVLDVGAGTGIATRELWARGAGVTAVEISRPMLAQARVRQPDLRALEADGTVLPIRDASVDLVCFAQSWHWMPEERRVAEVARVLRPGGHWAAWWSHAMVDGEPWFDGFWDVVEASCPGVNRAQRQIDWGAQLAASPVFHPPRASVVPWTRTVDLATFMTDQRSHSYLAALDEARLADVLAEIEAVLAGPFGDGDVEVPYETRLWIAERR